MGYVKGGSKPSLIAGVGLGASYGVAGTLFIIILLAMLLILTADRIPLEGEQGLWCRSGSRKQHCISRGCDNPLYQDEVEGTCACWSIRNGLPGHLVLLEEIQGVYLWSLKLATL